MTGSQQAAAPPPHATTAAAAGQSPTPAQQRQAPVARPTGTTSRTARGLRRLRVAAALACLATGLAATGYLGTSGYQGSAETLAQQLTDIGEAHTEVGRTQVAAAASVAGRDADFAAVAGEAAVALSRADEAGAAGVDTGLPEAGRAYTDYVVAVTRAEEQAQADAEAAGAAYGQAQAVLDRQVLDPLATAMSASADRLEGRGRSDLTAYVGVAATLVLLAGCVWLARRTHRVVNPGLAGATLITAGITVLAVNPASLPGSAGETLESLRQQQHVVAALQDARTADLAATVPAVDDATVQRQWDMAVEVIAVQALGWPLEQQQAWEDYATAHEALAAAEGAEARQDALDDGEAAMAPLLEWAEDEAAAGHAQLRAQVGRPAVVTSGVAALLGLVAAALAWTGIGRRLRDYR